MKIAEETGDTDMKEAAKVNFGMANASMKWTNHVTSILQNIQSNVKEDREEDEDNDDDDEEEYSTKNRFPDINKK